MPKDEFDFDDALELNGVALYTDEDTQHDMAECFVEEFLMLGYNHQQLLALFRSPHYIGMNRVLQNKGETFVKQVISDVCARWGKKIEWPPTCSSRGEEAQCSSPPVAGAHSQGLIASAAGAVELDENRTDPLGNPVPKLNL
jgi:hypothetical protein